MKTEKEIAVNLPYEIADGIVSGFKDEDDGQSFTCVYVLTPRNIFQYKPEQQNLFTEQRVGPV